MRLNLDQHYFHTDTVTNHKHYNFLDCDWFKRLLISTNSLAKLLLDSLLSDSLVSDSLVSDSLVLNSLLLDSLLSDSLLSNSLLLDSLNTIQFVTGQFVISLLSDSSISQSHSMLYFCVCVCMCACVCFCVFGTLLLIGGAVALECLSFLVSPFFHNLAKLYLIFSAECTIGMVRGLTPLKHCGAMAIRCKL